MQPDAALTPIGKITDMIEAELAAFADPEIAPFIRSLLVPPKPVSRAWGYGQEGQEYVCWHVMEDPKEGTGIAFCEEGFGPRCPWGLVSLDPARRQMGDDSAWFTKFLDAFFESFSATQLDIYQVFIADTKGGYVPFDPASSAGSWDNAWAEIERLRQAGVPGGFFAGTARYKQW